MNLDCMKKSLSYESNIPKLLEINVLLLYYNICIRLYKSLVGGSSQLSKKRFMLGRTSGFKPSDVYSKSQMLL